MATSYGYDNIYQLLSATQGGSTTESYSGDEFPVHPDRDVRV